MEETTEEYRICAVCHHIICSDFHFEYNGETYDDVCNRSVCQDIYLDFVLGEDE